MTRKSTTLMIAAAVSAMTAGMAVAGPLESGQVTLGFDNLSNDAADSDGLWLRGDTNVDVFGFATDLGLTFGDVGGDDTATLLSVAPKMKLGAGIDAGVFVDYAMSDDRDGLTAVHYGVEAEYEARGIEFAGYAGKGTVETDSMPDVDSDVFGISAKHELNTSWDVSAFYDVEAYDAGDVTETGIAVGYDVTALAMPVYLTGTVSRIDNDGDKSDRVGVTLTVPFGKAADKGYKKAHKHSVSGNGLFTTAD